MIIERLDEFLKQPRSPSGIRMVGAAVAVFRRYVEEAGLDGGLVPSTLIGFDQFLQTTQPRWGSQTRVMTIWQIRSFINWLRRQGVDVPEQSTEGLPQRIQRRKKKVKMDQPEQTLQAPDEPLDRGDFTESPPEPEPAPAQVQAQPQIHVHVPAAPARGGRGRPAAAEPAAPAASTTFKRAFSNAETIKVRKVDDLGNERLIDEYPIAVLQRTRGDIELFVLRQLAPRMGPGDYLVEGFNSRGELMGSRRVQVGEPQQGSSSFGAPLSFSSASPLDRIVDRLNQIENGMRVQHNQPPKSMIEQAEEMARLKQLFGGDQSSMLMYMLSQRPEAKGDPMILTELHSLKAQVEQAKMTTPIGPGPGTLLPPIPMSANHDVDYLGLAKLIETMRPVAPPPPPAAPDPMAMFTAMGQMFTTMMAPMIAAQNRSGPSPVEEVLRAQVADLKEEIHDMNQAPPRGLAEIVGELQLIKQIPELLGNTKSDDVNGFIGVLNKFIDKFPSNAAALKDLASEVRKNEAQRVQAQQAQQQPPQLPDGNQPAVPPPEFVESISRLTSADNPVDRMTIVMESVWILGKQPDFKDSVEHMIKLLQERQKPEAIAEVKGLLQNCVNAGMIGQDVAQQTGQDFDRNFETVAKYIDKLTGKAEAVTAGNGNGAGKPVEAAAPPESKPADDSDEPEQPTA